MTGSDLVIVELLPLLATINSMKETFCISGVHRSGDAEGVNDLRHKPELKKVYGRGRSGALGA